MTGPGHNSAAPRQLRSIIERVERLNVEKDGLTKDIAEVYSEAKANGFDTKILRRVVALRKLEVTEREEMQSLIDVYMTALGMLPEEGDEA